MPENRDMPSLAGQRTEYRHASLSERDIDPDPIHQLTLWLSQAITAKVNEPTAMVLATSNREGQASARVLLCKGIEDGKLIFFTNYESRKGQMLNENPHAAIVFFWPELERQIRIEGDVTKIASADSDAYFCSRPLGSRLGACASPQSQPIESREMLEKKMAELEKRYANGNVPRPPHWGGYALTPNRIEFWQGRPSRLHDRIEFVRQPQGWIIQRLAP